MSKIIVIILRLFDAMGGTKSRSRNKIVQDIWAWCMCAEQVLVICFPLARCSQCGG